MAGFKTYLEGYSDFALNAARLNVNDKIAKLRDRIDHEVRGFHLWMDRIESGGPVKIDTLTRHRSYLASLQAEVASLIDSLEVIEGEIKRRGMMVESV